MQNITLFLSAVSFTPFIQSISFLQAVYILCMVESYSIILRQDFLLATHVRTQSNRNVHAAILIYVVLQECDQSSGRSQYGIVQCVYQISSVFTLGTDTQTSCLCITQGRTGTNLKVLLLSGAPCFYVAGFYFRSARSPLQHSRVRTGTSRLRKNSTV